MYCTIQDLIAKVMVLDQNMFSARADSFQVGNCETALVIFKDISFEVAGENMCARDSHIIDETVRRTLCMQVLRLDTQLMWCLEQFPFEIY